MSVLAAYDRSFPGGLLGLKLPAKEENWLLSTVKKNGMNFRPPAVDSGHRGEDKLGSAHGTMAGGNGPMGAWSIPTDSPPERSRDGVLARFLLHRKMANYTASRPSAAVPRHMSWNMAVKPLAHIPLTLGHNRTWRFNAAAVLLGVPTGPMCPATIPTA